MFLKIDKMTKNTLILILIILYDYQFVYLNMDSEFLNFVSNSKPVDICVSKIISIFFNN